MLANARGFGLAGGSCRDPHRRLTPLGPYRHHHGPGTKAVRGWVATPPGSPRKPNAKRRPVRGVAGRRWPFGRQLATREPDSSCLSTRRDRPGDAWANSSSAASRCLCRQRASGRSRRDRPRSDTGRATRTRPPGPSRRRRWSRPARRGSRMPTRERRSQAAARSTPMGPSSSPYWRRWMLRRTP